jgi:hypothetical protein
MSISSEAIQASQHSLERVLPDVQGPTVTMCLTYPSYFRGNEIIKNIEEFLKYYFPTRLKQISTAQKTS